MGKIKVRATLIELYSRVVDVFKGNGENIYYNGDNNLYPNECELVISNSPTASRCANVMAKYISGIGVLNEDDTKEIDYADLPIVNKKKHYKITDIIDMASRSIAKQRGVWFHISWGIDPFTGKLKQTAIDVLDYVKPRLSKEDTEENLGKIYVRDWAEKTKSKKTDSDWYYPYNPDENVVIAQIKSDNDGVVTTLEEDIKNYRGQIYYLNLNPEYTYAESPIHAVYNDADTENRISIYTNKNAKDGFLGKTVILTQGLDDEENEQIKEDIKEFLGAENSSNIYHLDVEQTEDLSNVLKIEQFKAQFDDKLFEVTDKRVLRNIFGAFNNIPPALVLSSEGSLFGTNADTYNEMKVFYSEQTSEERSKLERALKYVGFPVKIKPIAL